MKKKIHYLHNFAVISGFARRHVSHLHGTVDTAEGLLSVSPAVVWVVRARILRRQILRVNELEIKIAALVRSIQVVPQFHILQII